ncbi:pancreatic lipase-related protein 2-like [Uranotaenia lowii]|uniref:pancreatic lipase-related protein 2-like n=1 Tax=Uranotaenia lowii TaxID=190385 RepID=UPI00247AD07C|nr:pancreatic lipase-related protein 2-like [Uranotaenia lowii]
MMLVLTFLLLLIVRVECHSSQQRLINGKGGSSSAKRVNEATLSELKHFFPGADGRMHQINGYNKESEHFSFVAERDTVFRLYTQGNPSFEVLAVNDTSSVLRSKFNASHPTRFTIHGFTSSGDDNFNSMVRDQYFKLGEYNMIVVDWRAGSGFNMSFPSYLQSRKRVGSVGRATSRLIDTLVQASNVSLSSISLIGYSLGAHVAGNVGKAQQGRISTIIGLDPAGPLFFDWDSDRLSSRDAQYVEVLHTSLAGYSHPIGTADFYANGGIFIQPGCSDIWCAHDRAPEYFAESLTSQVGFMARKCRRLTINIFDVTCTPDGQLRAKMGGEPANTGSDVMGSYRFETNSVAPFAQGDQQSKRKSLKNKKKFNKMSAKP